MPPVTVLAPLVPLGGTLCCMARTVIYMGMHILLALYWRPLHMRMTLQAHFTRQPTPET